MCLDRPLRRPVCCARRATRPLQRVARAATFLGTRAPVLRWPGLRAAWFCSRGAGARDGRGQPARPDRPGLRRRQGLAAPGSLQPLPHHLFAGAPGVSPRGAAGSRARLRRLESRLLLLPRRHDDRQPRRGREPHRLSPASHGNDLTGYEGLRSEEVGLPDLVAAHGVRHLPRPPRQRPPALSARRPAGALPLLPLRYSRVRPGEGEPHRQPHPRGRPRRPPRRGGPAEGRRGLPDPVRPGLPAGAGQGRRRVALGPRRPSRRGRQRGRSAASPATRCTATRPRRRREAAGGRPGERCRRISSARGATPGRAATGAASPHPNPGGTTTGRTYHPVDDDEANGFGAHPRDPRASGVALRRRRPAAAALHDLPRRRTAPWCRRRCCAAADGRRLLRGVPRSSCRTITTGRGSSRNRVRLAASRPRRTAPRKGSSARTATGRTTPASARRARATTSRC